MSFFFQAEDGIRDLTVTGVQTCALPIFARRVVDRGGRDQASARAPSPHNHELAAHDAHARGPTRSRERGARLPPVSILPIRSEEHTSELQSQSNLVCRLLLEKKKKHTAHPHAQPSPPC